MARFVAIDVETANSKFSSICQVGIVVFDDGDETFGQSILLDPEEHFSANKIRIHGITAQHCRSAPTFSRFCSSVLRLLSNQIVVCHSTFERTAIGLACAKFSLLPLSCHWIDSCHIAKVTWPQLANQSGYSLSNLASHFDIQYRPHDALMNARTAGQVLLRALGPDTTKLNTFIDLSEEAPRIARPEFSRDVETLL
jgi:DNA polymerase-3 subunit epsilon